MSAPGPGSAQRGRRPAGAPVGTGQHATRPVDASMGLLYEIMYRPEDPAYAEAAQRRRPPRNRSARWGAVGVHLALGAALGAITVTAIVALRVPEPSAIEGRSLLTERITERAADADALAQANATLSAEISELQTAALDGADSRLLDELAESELVSGAVPVSGPGIVVELDDPAVADPAQLDAESRVQDIDLQVVANGLRAAGAEAIAINGHRLTTLSAIRSAGQAILVDLAPLVAPYRVEAIGDPRSLQTELARSAVADHLTLLSGTYGIRTAVRPVEEIHLPGAGPSTLRYASSPDGVASSERPDQEELS